MEARAYGKEQREYTFRGRCAAPPEAVYETLSDLRSHLEWGGDRQWKSFRLVALTAPDGPAVVGTTFATVGRIPTVSARWEDESQVTAAEPPRLFEITTRGRIRWPNRPHAEATVVHRYEIAPQGSGSSVTYRISQQRLREPAWGMRYPVLRSITARVWLPIWFGRGFRSLLRLAAVSPVREPAERASRPGD